MAGRETLVLALAKWQTTAKGWGLARLVLGALPHRKPNGLRFERFLGSGHEGGFGLSPGWDRFGYLGLFETESQAHDFIDHSPQLQSYRDHGDALRVHARTFAAALGSQPRQSDTPCVLDPTSW